VASEDRLVQLAERLAIVDWMQAMAHKREMARDTLYLSIHNFDKVAGLRASLGDNKAVEVLSLISLWMASKVSEQRPISLKMLPLCVSASSH